MGEVHRSLADGEVLVLLPHVVMDVHVGDTVAEDVDHRVDLPRGVGVPDVEAYGQVRATDDLRELGGTRSEHDRELRHVLYAHGHAELAPGAI